jgi:hypothetical protein
MGSRPPSASLSRLAAEITSLAASISAQEESLYPASGDISIEILQRLGVDLERNDDGRGINAQVHLWRLAGPAAARSAFLAGAGTCRGLLAEYQVSPVTTALLRMLRLRFATLALEHTRDLEVMALDAPDVVQQLRSAAVPLGWGSAVRRWLAAALAMLACAGDEAIARRCVGEIRRLHRCARGVGAAARRDRLGLALNLARVGLAATGDELQAALLAEALGHFDACPPRADGDPALIVFHARAVLWSTRHLGIADAIGRLQRLRAHLETTTRNIPAPLLPHGSILSLWICNFTVLALFREAQLESRRSGGEVEDGDRDGDHADAEPLPATAEERLGIRAYQLHLAHRDAAAGMDVNTSDDEDAYIPGEFRIALVARLRGKKLV